MIFVDMIFINMIFNNRLFNNMIFLCIIFVNMIFVSLSLEVFHYQHKIIEWTPTKKLRPELMSNKIIAAIITIFHANDNQLN